MKKKYLLFLLSLVISGSTFCQIRVQSKAPGLQSKTIDNTILTDKNYMLKMKVKPGQFLENTPLLVAAANTNGNSVSISINAVNGVLGDVPNSKYFMFDCNKDSRDELMVINPSTMANDLRKLNRNASNNIVQAGAFMLPTGITLYDDIYFGEFSIENGSTFIINDKRSNQFWHYQHDYNSLHSFGRPYPMLSNWVVADKYLTGDFNGDGKTDLLAWDLAKNEFQVALHTKNATAYNGPANLVPAGVWLRAWAQSTDMNIVTGDFNGDRKDDIALVHQPSGEWWVALSNGSSFQPSQGYKSGIWLKPWAVGSQHKIFATDVNNDGKCDLVAYDSQQKSFQAVLSNGQYFDYSFKKEFIGSPITNPEQITFGKFEGNCMISVVHILPSDAQFTYPRRAMSIYLTNYKRL